MGKVCDLLMSCYFTARTFSHSKRAYTIYPSGLLRNISKGCFCFVLKSPVQWDLSLEINWDHQVNIKVLLEVFCNTEQQFFLFFPSLLWTRLTLEVFSSVCSSNGCKVAAGFYCYFSLSHHCWDGMGLRGSIVVWDSVKGHSLCAFIPSS